MDLKALKSELADKYTDLAQIITRDEIGVLIEAAQDALTLRAALIRIGTSDEAFNWDEPGYDWQRLVAAHVDIAVKALTPELNATLNLFHKAGNAQ